MNNIESFILSVIQKIDKLGVISWGFQQSNSTGTFKWWTIGMNDYDIYKSDIRFQNLASAYRKIARKRGIKLIFVYQNATEEILSKLLNEENLLMDV